MVILLQSVKTQFCSLFWHICYCKKQHSSFITKCDRLLLQSVSGITKFDRLLLQSPSGITKRDSYYKLRRNAWFGIRLWWLYHCLLAFIIFIIIFVSSNLDIISASSIRHGNVHQKMFWKWSLKNLYHNPSWVFWGKPGNNGIKIFENCNRLPHWYFTS